MTAGKAERGCVSFGEVVRIFTRQSHINQVLTRGRRNWLTYWQDKAMIRLWSDKQTNSEPLKQCIMNPNQFWCSGIILNAFWRSPIGSAKNVDIYRKAPTSISLRIYGLNPGEDLYSWGRRRTDCTGESSQSYSKVCTSCSCSEQYSPWRETGGYANHITNMLLLKGIAWSSCWQITHCSEEYHSLRPEVNMYLYLRPLGWTTLETGNLPSARYGLRAAIVNSILYVTGGYSGADHSTDVLGWDGSRWFHAGDLAVGKSYHAVVGIPSSILPETNRTAFDAGNYNSQWGKLIKHLLYYLQSSVCPFWPVRAR